MSVRTKQPQGGPGRIDPGNPLGRGLAFLVNAGDQTSPYDIVNRRSLSTGASTLTRTTTPQGRAYKSALANAGAQLAGSTRLVTDDGAFTGEFSITVHANPASSTSPNIVYGPMGGAAPESYFQFNGTLASLAGAGRASFITPGGTGVEAFGVVDGLFHTFTAVRRADNSLEMWVDGALKATASFVGAIATAARIDTLYGYFSGNYGCPFDVPLVVAHNRALLGSEVKALHANPWQLIEAPQPIHLYMSSGGAVNTAINPGAASVALTGYAPSIAQTAHQTVSPGAGSLAITGYAPAVTQSNNQAFAPAVGSIAITGYAPTVARTEHLTLAPAAGALTITGYAPTVFQGVPAVTPDVFSATIMRESTINSQVTALLDRIASQAGTMSDNEYSSTTMLAPVVLAAELNSVGTMSADAINQTANIL